MDDNEQKLVERMKPCEKFVGKYAIPRKKDADIGGLGCFVELAPSPPGSPRLSNINDFEGFVADNNGESINEHTCDYVPGNLREMDLQQVDPICYASPEYYSNAPCPMTTSKEDYSSPGLVCWDQDPEEFLSYSFQNFLSEIFAKVHIDSDLDEIEQNYREQTVVHREYKLIDLEKSDQPPYVDTLEPLPEVTDTNPIVEAVLNSDVDRYFNEEIVKWWMTTGYLERLSPIMVAAENKRVDVVDVMLDDSKYVEKSGILTKKYNRDRFVKILVDHSILDKIKEEHQKTIIESYSSITMESMKSMESLESLKSLEELFDAAAVIGNRETIEYLEDLLEKNPDLPRKYGSFVFLLAQFGHFELFDNLDQQKKICQNRSNSPLVWLLGFSDEQVRTQLFTYRSVPRIDQFAFVSEVITRKRIGLLEESITMVFSNPDNFNRVENAKKCYESYGLPDTVPLPMETALSRTGDFNLLNRIANLYSKQDNFTKKLIEEDALRCIRSIQDKAFRCTEHLRLAVIFMMMKFVRLESSSFKEVMRMYYNQNVDDRVEFFIIKNYIENDFPRFKPNVRYITWQEAFETAFEVVKKWENESVEGNIPMNLSEARNISVAEKNKDQVPSSILMTKERMEKKRLTLKKKKPRREEYVVCSLKNALKEIKKIA
uniref:ANK_REP_REGION domain-containing protein n=1 Tax=Caenorhabditis tropicalis TaxID=1561998 RepID=A0A1I7V0N3_9PELO